MQNLPASRARQDVVLDGFGDRSHHVSAPLLQRNEPKYRKPIESTRQIATRATCLLRKSSNRIRLLLSNDLDEFHISVAQRLSERFHTREPNLRIAWLRLVLTSGNSNGSGAHFFLGIYSFSDLFYFVV
jgi:hypothetical protein